MKEVFQIDRRTKKNIRKIYDDNNILISRDCSKCNEHLEYEMFPKTKSKSYKDGIRGQCKKCTYKYFKQYGEDKKEHLKEYRKEYYKDNDDVKKYRSEYYQKNKDKISNYHKKWREENKGYLQSYYQEWKEKNKEHLYLYKKAWYEANLENVTQYKKEWARENQHKVKMYIAKRKTLMKKLPQKMTENDWLNTCAIFDGKCALTSIEDATLDHFIPLYIGHGGTITGNCYPLNGSMNFSKNKENPFEWIKTTDIAEKIDKDKWDFLIRYLASENNLSVEEFIDYVYWCFDNPRDADDIKDSALSVDLWKKSKLVFA